VPAYRSWLKYGDGEIANAARVGGLAKVGAPTSDALVFGGASCPCSAALLGYPDWWTGQEAFFGDTYADITDAPWYDAARCESERFHGIWPMVIEGLGDPVEIERELVESHCDGGHATRHRDRTKTVRVEAMLIACDHAAANYGLQWLNCELRSARFNRGADLTYLASSPEGSCVEPASLVRNLVDVVLLSSPKVVDETGGLFNKSNRHGSIWRVEWTMGTGNPYAYGPAVNLPVVFDEDVPDPLVWSDDCVDDTGCPPLITTIVNPDCPPVTLPEPARLPTGCTHESSIGCTPLCEGRRRVWTFEPTADLTSLCGETVVDVWVSNQSETEPLYGVNLAWVPCGGDRDCDRVSDITISYIPPASSVVLDSVRGRPRVYQNGQFYQAAGLVRGPNGPWSGLVLDTYTCWELILDSAPDTGVDVSIWARPREA
jgi:hypothetical protein